MSINPPIRPILAMVWCHCGGFRNYFVRHGKIMASGNSMLVDSQWQCCWPWKTEHGAQGFEHSCSCIRIERILLSPLACGQEQRQSLRNVLDGYGGCQWQAHS